VVAHPRRCLKPGFCISDLATADVLTIRVSCSPSNPLIPIAQTFAAAAVVLAAQRPLVVTAVAPLAIWSSAQVNTVCSAKAYIDGLAGLDYNIKHVPGTMGYGRLQDLHSFSSGSSSRSACLPSKEPLTLTSRERRNYLAAHAYLSAEAFSAISGRCTPSGLLT
jgi:hypothetical protein